MFFFSLISHWTRSVKTNLVFVKWSKAKYPKWLIRKFPFKIIYYLVWEPCFLISTIRFCSETPKLKKKKELSLHKVVEVVLHLSSCFHHGTERTGERWQGKCHGASMTVAGAQVGTLHMEERMVLPGFWNSKWEALELFSHILCLTLFFALLLQKTGLRRAKKIRVEGDLCRKRRKRTLSCSLYFLQEREN